MFIKKYNKLIKNIINEERHGTKLNIPYNRHNILLDRLIKKIDNTLSNDILNEFNVLSVIDFYDFKDEVLSEMNKSEDEVDDDSIADYVLNNLNNEDSIASIIKYKFYQDRLEEIWQNLNNDLYDNKIYRKIVTNKSLDEVIKYSEKNGVGCCWAKNYNKSYAYFTNYSDKSKPLHTYIFVGIATDKNINWDATLILRMQDEEEDEIRLQANKPIMISKIIDVDNKKRDNINKVFSSGEKLSYAQFLDESANNDNFKKWFGNSKVVDEFNKPMIMYHGSPNDFEEFKDDLIGKNLTFGKGFYFSNSRQLGKSYAGENGKIFKCYIKIENPYIIKSPKMSFEEGLRKRRIFRNNPNAREDLIKQGYDGIMLIEDDGYMEVVAFYPNQIKSVKNNGNWDSKLNNINESLQKIETLKSPIYITNNMYDIIKLHNKIPSMRIIIDENKNLYIIGNALHQIHSELFDEAVTAGYYKFNNDYEKDAYWEELPSIIIDSNDYFKQERMDDYFNMILNCKDFVVYYRHYNNFENTNFYNYLIKKYKCIPILNEAEYNAYHGSPNIFDVFNIDYAGKGDDTYGPGFYFIDKLHIASTYGKVGEYTITINKPISLTKKMSIKNINKMICLYFNEKSIDNVINKLENEEDLFYDSTLSDYAPDPDTAIISFVNNVLLYNDSEYDAFLTIWSDLYRYNNKKFLQDIIKLGYDGVILKDKFPNSIMYISYDPSKIKKIKQIDEAKKNKNNLIKNIMESLNEEIMDWNNFKNKIKSNVDLYFSDYVYIKQHNTQYKITKLGNIYINRNNTGWKLAHSELKTFNDIYKFLQKNKIINNDKKIVKESVYSSDIIEDYNYIINCPQKYFYCDTSSYDFGIKYYDDIEKKMVIKYFNFFKTEESRKKYNKLCYSLLSIFEKKFPYGKSLDFVKKKLNDYIGDNISNKTVNTLYNGYYKDFYSNYLDKQK